MLFTFVENKRKADEPGGPMKKELQAEILTVKKAVNRLLHNVEKIADVAQRDRVRSHLKKVYEELGEAQKRLQLGASCRGDAPPVRGINEGQQMPLRY
jgi:hypothetical protein